MREREWGASSQGGEAVVVGENRRSLPAPRTTNELYNKDWKFMNLFLKTAALWHQPKVLCSSSKPFVISAQ